MERGEEDKHLTLNPDEIAIAWIGLNHYRIELTELIKYSPESEVKEMHKETLPDILKLMEKMEGAVLALESYRRHVNKIDNIKFRGLPLLIPHQN